jgi:hypothetical protein
LSFQLPATIGRRRIVLPSPLAAEDDDDDDNDDDSALHEPMPYCLGGDVATSRGMAATAGTGSGVARSTWTMPGNLASGVDDDAHPAVPPPPTPAAGGGRPTSPPTPTLPSPIEYGA